MWFDTREPGKIGSDSAAIISTLIDSALLENRDDILRKANLHSILGFPNFTRDDEIHVQKNGWALDFSGRFAKETYIDGTERFHFYVDARTHDTSPERVRDIQMGVFSENLIGFEVFSYFERRWVNLPGGAIYMKGFTKQVHIGSGPEVKPEIDEFEVLTLPYKGDKLCLHVFFEDGCKEGDIDSLQYVIGGNICTKTYGVMRGKEFFQVGNEQEFTTGFTDEEVRNGTIPEEFYHRDVPVIGKELEGVWNLVKKGRELAGPRDLGMDKLTFLKKK